MIRSNYVTQLFESSLKAFRFEKREFFTEAAGFLKLSENNSKPLTK